MIDTRYGTCVVVLRGWLCCCHGAVAFGVVRLLIRLELRVCCRKSSVGGAVVALCMHFLPPPKSSCVGKPRRSANIIVFS